MKKIPFVITVLLLLTVNFLSAQNIRITGTVTDRSTGAPLEFVTVQLKGTSTGVSTLENGTYVISAPANGILLFSSIGYRISEVPVDNRTVINIILEPESLRLDEIIMIAYGTAKKESVTGAISTISSRAIEKRAVSSVASVLEGQAAGVQVNNTYGEPGNDPEIRIRGFSSINGSNSPLYVIDGVPFGGNISDLNPSDIENLTILKDAASSALYGNRASNGVVLITTRKGKSSNKVSITATVNQGIFSRGLKEYDMVDSFDYMEVMWKGYRNSLMTSQPDLYPTVESANAQATATLVPTYLKYNIFNKPDNALFDSNGKLLSDTKIRPGYDDLVWFDAMERMGHRQEYSVSGDGASDKHNFFFSAGYLDENGYLKSSDFNRFTGRANISITPKKWLKAGINLSGSYQVYNSTTGNPTDNSLSYANPFYFARNMAPIYPVYLHDMATGDYILDENGKKQYDKGDLNARPQNLGRHVVWEYELDMDRTTRNTISGQAFADISFLNGFTLSIKGDINLRNQERQRYQNPIIGDGMGVGRANKTIYRYKNYTFQQILTWNREFGPHNIDFLGAHENYSYNYAYTYGFKTNETFKGDNKEFINFTVITDLDGFQRDYRTESCLSRVRYNYDNRYFFDASFRRDGTSKFYPENRWGNFWSAGGSWIVSREPFMAPLEKQVNDLKLRVSYGEVGNDGGTDDNAIDFHAYMALYSMNQNANLGAVYKIQNEALDLVWEAASSFGVALEGRYFNRMNLNLEYFDKRSKDLLFDVYLPLSAGATSTTNAESTIKKNIGSVSNRGFEFTMDFDLIKSRNFRWNIGLMGTYMKNKIISLPEQNRENGIISGTKKYMEGHDRYEFWLYQFAGIDQMTGNSLYLPDYERYYVGEAEEGKNPIPEQWLVTINEENYTRNTTYAKRDWSGSAIPHLFGSFTTSLSYKNLDLSVLCTYSLGGKTLDYSYEDAMEVTANPHAVHKDILRAWDGVPAGITEGSPDRIDPKGIPVVNYQLSTYNNDQLSTRFLLNGSYLVIKNISLAYSLPQRFVNKLDISSVALNFSAENLATFTKMRGMDPQQAFTGLNNNGFVTARIFSLGINIKL
ncbi:MAG: SusC/RagA family TonB-linked outer membrane protein [Bacteroidales bacterium]|nr:SusC/RagA family TonB-linked outer membrane protein [Bacteroidales bacterium]MDD4107818.1 SusC/RagA family TonB-linked outer membrane protein [Prolixibacteraceae bacterium]